MKTLITGTIVTIAAVNVAFFGTMAITGNDLSALANVGVVGLIGSLVTYGKFESRKEAK